MLGPLPADEAAAVDATDACGGGEQLGGFGTLQEATATTDGAPHAAACAQQRGSDGDSACSREESEGQRCGGGAPSSSGVDVSWQDSQLLQPVSAALAPLLLLLQHQQQQHAQSVGGGDGSNGARGDLHRLLAAAATVAQQPPELKALTAGLLVQQQQQEPQEQGTASSAEALQSAAAATAGGGSGGTAALGAPPLDSGSTAAPLAGRKRPFGLAAAGSSKGSWSLQQQQPSNKKVWCLLLKKSKRQ